MKNKIIQIIVASSYIFALCDDGSVWRKKAYSSKNENWERFDANEG